MFCSRFSIWSRSKDKIELVSSGLASDDCAEKEHPEYSRELETLCEQLQATLEGLVRCRRPAPSVRRRPEGLHTSLLRLLFGLLLCLPYKSCFRDAVLTVLIGVSQGSVPAPGPHREQIRLVGLSLLLSSHPEASRRHRLPAELYLWTLNCEFYTTFMCHIKYSAFDFFFPTT